MLACRDVTALVTDYVESRLSPWDRLRFQLHLGLCRGCRAYVRQVRLTARSLGALPPPELPSHVEEELLRRFAAWKTGPRKPE
jgi:anti-sigma factor RsiW